MFWRLADLNSCPRKTYLEPLLNQLNNPQILVVNEMNWK